MPGVKPVMLLVKLPVPVPSIVVLFAVVGLVDVDQQTPLAVTSEPPSLVIFPPDTAVVAVTEPTAVVVSEGNWIFVVNVSWLPYAVPSLLVA